MITLNAPDNHCCVGFEGSEYEIRGGQVVVPDHAELSLRAHGYHKPKEDDADPVPPPPRKRR